MSLTTCTYIYMHKCGHTRVHMMYVCMVVYMDMCVWECACLWIYEHGYTEEHCKKWKNLPIQWRKRKQVQTKS